MGADRHERDRRNRLPPFVPLLIGTLDAPAWKSMSHGARSLYVALKRRYGATMHNNGRIFLSQRTAASELGSHHNEIARWFRELRHYGFIEQTKAGSLGLEGKGKAPHWRLTELGYMREPATRDFLKWKGEKFVDKKMKTRAGNGARGVREIQHSHRQEMAHATTRKRAGIGAHTAKTIVPEMAHISSLPLTSALADASNSNGASAAIAAQNSGKTAQ